MHDTQTTPHDPYRMLACAIIIQAIKDYSQPEPRNTGTTGAQGRISNWQVDRGTADYFLFKDIDYMGAFHMVCILIKINPNTARKMLIDNISNFRGFIVELDKRGRSENSRHYKKAAKALDIATDK
jgi:hypothetical protein